MPGIIKLSIGVVVSLVGVAVSPVSAASEDCPVVDARYRTACGPIACYVALRQMGTEVSLSDVVSRCDWRDGEFTSLRTMFKVMNAYPGISCRAIRMSPAQLRLEMRRELSSVIVFTRRSVDEPINHATTVINQTDRGFTLVDYPVVNRMVSDHQLAELWDGQALIVEASVFRDRGVVFYALSGSLIAGGFGVLCVAAIFRKSVK